MNNITKTILSIPIILIALYFSKFIGIILIITRLLLIKKNHIKTFIFFIILGLLIYIPQLVNLVNGDIVASVINNQYYPDFKKYANFLIGLGIVFIVISSIVEKITRDMQMKLQSLMIGKMQQEREITKENDLKIKEKQLRAKTTNVIICENCGADNIVTEKVGVCKYCRSNLENK